MLKKELLEIKVMEKRQLLIEKAEEEILEKIKKLKAKDNVKTVEEMKKTEVKVLRNDKWQIEDKLVLKEEKVYVLKNEELRLEIIRLHHDMLIAEYKGQQKMVKLVTRNYWQPRVTRKVKQYMERYNQCQRIKNRVEILVGKLRPNIVPERSWQYMSVDFITKLLVSRDYDSILIVCNRFSKILYFIMITEKQWQKS